MERSLHLTCPCSDYEFYLEFQSIKLPTLFCPFCCSEIEDVEIELDDDEDSED